MKVAVAADQENKVAQHFGHCSVFVMADIAAGQIKDKTPVLNPGHRPGFLPRFLKEKGVETIVSGGMGGSAIGLFEELGIQVITGAEGKVDEVLEHYRQGMLRSSGSACNEHQHSDECHK